MDTDWTYFTNMLEEIRGHAFTRSQHNLFKEKKMHQRQNTNYVHL